VEEGQPRRAVVGLTRLEPVLREVVAHELDDVLFVVDDEYMAHDNECTGEPRIMYTHPRPTAVFTKILQ